jgi:tellurite resistance protein TerB
LPLRYGTQSSGYGSYIKPIPEYPPTGHAPNIDFEPRVVSAAIHCAAGLVCKVRVEAVEREAAVHYIDQRQVARTMSQERIAEFFDNRAQRLQDRDFADLIGKALRPVAALSLTFDVIRIAKLVAEADRHVDRNEAQVIRLIAPVNSSVL